MYVSFLGIISSQRGGSAPPVTEYMTPFDSASQGTGAGQSEYVGTWTHAPSIPEFYQNTGSFSNVTDNYVNIRFSGRRIELLTEKLNTHGIVAISIDGGPETMVDLYMAAPGQRQVLVYNSGVLTEGNHTLKARVTGTKNVASTGYYAIFDLVRVYTGIAPAPVGDADYYVGGPGASDSNVGSAVAPFLTPQRAANVAIAGDIIELRQGTYRQTVVPVNSGTSGNPIVWRRAAGQIATINGCDTIPDGDWAPYDLTGTKRIYRAPVSNGPMYTEFMTGFDVNNLIYNNTQLLSQQLFRGTEMQFQSQFPKFTSPENMLERSSQRSTVHAGAWGPANITDAGFATFGTNALDEGELWTQGWFITRTRHITSQSGNTITYQTTGDADHSFSKFYKVFNKLQLLTQAREWHYDGTYFYSHVSSGASPVGMEYKKRNWGFDLRAKNYHTIEGLSFHACEPVMTTTGSTNIIVDNIRANYTSHHMLESNGGNNGYFDSSVQTGMKLLGPNNVVKNSEFNFASGVTLWLGSNTIAQNNKFQNGDYGGFYSGLIKLMYNGAVGSTNVKILNNTFSRCGRGCIELGGVVDNVTHTNLEIGYNDMSGHIMICVDGGAIYSARKTILVNARFHHNWFHDIGFNEAGTGQQKGIQVTGNYFDQASGPLQYDHNIHWNGVSGAGRTGAYSGDYYTQSWWNERNIYANGKSYFYNNIYATATGGGQYSTVVYNNAPAVKDVHRNNIYRSPIVQNWGIDGATPDTANCLLSGVNPQFVGGSLSTPQTYWQLAAGSPGRNTGQVLPPYTDGYLESAPDIGAYEYGATPWVPGYVPVT